MSEPSLAELSYSSTVPRSLVHRAAICEVFLTDSRRTSDDAFQIAAQLPRTHSYYSDQLSGTYDPLSLLEVCRQTSILLAHEYLGAPPDHNFTFNEGDLRVRSHEALLIGPLPGRVLLDVTVVAEKHRGNQRVGVTLHMRMTVDGRAAASMDMTIQWMPPHVWADLRARGRAALDLETVRDRPTRRVPPAAVGRRAPRNVVLSEAVVLGRELISQVAVDQSHPSLFDHPLDHIPGALLFEAYRQTALYAAQELLGLSPHRLALTRCTAAFTRFGELELPTNCRAELVDDPHRHAVLFRLEIGQEETIISTAEVSLQCTSPTGRRLLPQAPSLALQAD